MDKNFYGDIEIMNKRAMLFFEVMNTCMIVFFR